MIVNYLVITSVTDIKMETTTIFVILIFMWRELGQQSIGLTVAMLTSWRLWKSIKLPAGVPG